MQLTFLDFYFMIKMRGSIYHADISNGFNVRVYSTEPPEDTVVRQCHFII